MNKDLQTKFNQIAEMEQDMILRLRKAGASDDQVREARRIAQEARDSAEEQFGDALNKLNKGEAVTVKGGTTSPELNQKGMPDMAKVKGLGKSPNFARLKNVLKPGLGGLAAVGLTAAQSLLPEEAAASEGDVGQEVAGAVDRGLASALRTGMKAGSRALEEGDPSSLFLPGNVGEDDEALRARADYERELSRGAQEATQEAEIRGAVQGDENEVRRWSKLASLLNK